MAQRTEPAWRVWIDTGGTFTDCLAVDPAGRCRRAKVLSSSALRGTIIERLDATRVRVRQKWDAPDDLVAGFAFRLLDASSDERAPAPSGLRPGGAELRVARFEAEASVLALDGALPPHARPGAPFEVGCDEEAPLLAARLATGTPAGRPLPAIAMRLGTTRGTNALLERRGVPTALFITRGFGDLLRLGTQARPDLFALDVRKSEPLYDAVVETAGRLAADGAELVPVDLDALAAPADRLLARGVRVAAVALMHSHRSSSHERAVARFLRKRGFTHVSCSSDLAPFIKLFPRAVTSVIDACLSPVIDDYLTRVASALTGHGGPFGRHGQGARIPPVSGADASPASGPSSSFHVMTSAGGLVRAGGYHAKDSLLSGPAGGVAGAAVAGRRSGFDRVIAFDMGGTSTDVARYDGDYEYVFEHEVGGAHLVAPALAIESVAAGGGSICRFDGQRLGVGPESAGATPGPACYAAGGPLTLSDVNLLLGRLAPDRFEIPIDPRLARTELDRVRKALADAGQYAQPDALLAGFIDIADERMADAIRRISLQRGYDPSDYALVAFGGAGAQHACGVAGRLGIGAILVPPDAGLLSALGIGHALIERFAERQVLARLDQVEGELEALLAGLSDQARAAVRDEGVPYDAIDVRRRIVNCRFVGQDATLPIEFEPGVPIREAFQTRYRQFYGHQPTDRPVEVESLRVVASTRPDQVAEESPGETVEHPPSPSGTQQAIFAGQWLETPVFDRETLAPGATIAGPALIFEPHSATVIDTGWTARIDAAGAIILRRGDPLASLAADGAARSRRSQPTGRRGDREPGGPSPSKQPKEGDGPRDRPEAVRLELFTSRFRAIAVEMGAMLQRTALSVNVKERLDFSCAVLDADGELVVNAPHIPVHLGALGLCVRRLMRTIDMQPGDAIVTNHPACGGAHLPDITVVTPVFTGEAGLFGFVASRAHHAEIGGSRPGSMPPSARTLAEEGAVIAPMHLLRGGQADWDGMRRVLTAGPYPTRAVEDNLADLAAAVAANHRGAAALAALAERHGPDTVAHYMAALKALAERHIRAALARLGDGVYEASEQLDDGSPIRVRIVIAGDSATIDFAGSAPVHPGNLNATPAIVRSAVIYVLRLLIAEPLPLNEGLMRAVELRVPRGMLNPDFGDDPSSAPAVVGGNVETSQRIVDTLLKALGLAACSQGTMNNTLFGNERLGYYETVCGGVGAGPDFDGASAVHSHMTNTRITDPEVIEHRYPVRVERFEIRAGSGGAGRRRGGDGAVRELRFLAPMSLSVLSQHRREGPYGLFGGQPGSPGRNRVVRADGTVVELGSIDACEMAPGDRFILETPGGGGFGPTE